MTTALDAFFQRLRTLVNDQLREALARLGEGCPPTLSEALRYCLLAPGKRLRPILVFLGAEVAGGDVESAIPAACAVEMVHTYSLVHDDLPAMDDDDLRRGMPTCHRKYDEATAILVGDALLTLAFETLADGCPPHTAAASCRVLAQASGAAGMVGGQMVDLHPGGREESLETLVALHDRKTGALFRACLHLGVLAVQGERPDGPDQRLMDVLDVYGRCFGLAFQITDDLLDVEGDVESTGKQVRKDAAHGKLTYPALLGVEESRRRAKALYDEAAERLDSLDADAERLLELFRSTLNRDR